MILSYRDIFSKSRRTRIRASITTDHPASSFGQPVIVLEDGDVLDLNLSILLDYRIVRASKKERAQILKMGYLL